LRRLLLTWLAASAIPALIGAATVLLFYAGIDRSLLRGVVHDFGLLPPGNYPRVEATFFFPAMLCNYLTVSPFLLLAAFQRRWLNPTLCAVLLAVTIIAALFTETPGLVGFGLALAACIYIARGGRSRTVAIVGAAAAVFVTLAISAVTPILHPTAPYLIHLPGGHLVAPSVRLMTWTGAWKIFLAHPLFGAGIGTDGLWVVFLDPSGILHGLDDAHNSYLNIAAQCGLAGAAALIAMIHHVAVRTRLSAATRDGALSLLLGLAWLDGFAIQGFIGSFEDARHLWVLVGLWLASSRLDMARETTPTASARDRSG
jgi:O-antigen ligase